MGCLLFLHVMVKGQLVREVHSLLLASAPGLSSGLQLDSKCLYTLSHLTGPVSRNLTEELDASVSFLIFLWAQEAQTSLCTTHQPVVHTSLSFIPPHLLFPSSFFFVVPCVPSVVSDHLENR